eukprot:m.166541 g.166541  ORF g.166541 m.166541 type:complete len:85 (-) comp53146_c0_seq10:775-1029(-)
MASTEDTQQFFQAGESVDWNLLDRFEESRLFVPDDIPRFIESFSRSYLRRCNESNRLEFVAAHGKDDEESQVRNVGSTGYRVDS